MTGQRGGGYNRGVDTIQTRRWLVENLRLLWSGLNHLLWPAVCINCAESIGEADGDLCRKCWDELLESTGGDYCRRCGRDVGRYGIVDGACGQCMGREAYLDRIARAGVYSASLQTMTLGFKRGRTELDRVLGFLVRSALEGGAFAGRIELFVPVPLHWTRRLWRGYNQSLVLIRRLRVPRARVSTELVRMRRTKMQPAMGSEAKRRANVAGAFAVRKGHPFSGKAVCLVDDIKTTGATLDECARVLKEAGAARVYALVLAVAGQSVS
ncbi:MAG: ComF family protein [Phycisphaerales bacterium]|nr:MAG: ComF family protein [Phycisphaerales bacterium]